MDYADSILISVVVPGRKTLDPVRENMLRTFIRRFPHQNPGSIWSCPRLMTLFAAHLMLRKFNESGVPGTIYTYQQRACMEDALGDIWFQEHFLKSCGPERPQLILLDSHSSHETLN